MTSNERVVMAVTLTLCFVIIGMMAALVIAIFDPNVPDDAIFSIIGPAFQTVVGGFIGLITGIKIGQAAEQPAQEPSDVI